MTDRLACPCCGNWLPDGVVPREELAGLLLAAGGNPTFARIVRRLARRPGHAVSGRDLADYLYRDDPDGGPLEAQEVISQIVCRHRNALRPYGWVLKSRAWSGYWLAVVVS